MVRTFEMCFIEEIEQIENTLQMKVNTTNMIEVLNINIMVDLKETHLMKTMENIKLYISYI